MDVDAFLKDVPYWDPQQLFRSPEKMDAQWYRSKVMKPDDKDIYGNEGTFYPSDEFIMFVSLTKQIPYEEISWLKGT